MAALTKPITPKTAITPARRKKLLLVGFGAIASAILALLWMSAE